MIDFMGNTVNKGDAVVYAVSRWSSAATVVGIVHEIDGQRALVEAQHDSWWGSMKGAQRRWVTRKNLLRWDPK